MTQPIVITTRPLEDAKADCEKLAQDHITAISAPMLNIIPLKVDVMAADLIEVDTDAIVFTSRHGVRCLPATKLHHLPCYCVGKATAEVAQEAGFANVITGGGTAQELSQIIIQDQRRYVFWPSALEIGFNIEDALAPHGIKTLRIAVYEAVASPALPEKIVKVLASGNVSAVLVYSQRSAEHFNHLLDRHGLESCRQSITLIAISPQVGAVCGENWHDVIIAKAPCQPAMFDAVRNLSYPF